MSMTVTNSTGTALALQALYVWWNNTSGHSGPDPTLDLLGVTLGGATIWSSNPGVYNDWFSVPVDSVNLPTGTSTVAFVFTQQYNQQNLGERIYIMFWTNGCQNYVIDSSN